MVLSKDARKLIRELYYDPKTGFNVERVYKIAKKKYPKEITLSAIRQFIKTQQIPARFAKAKDKVKRHFLTKKPDQQWGMDVVFIDLRAKPKKAATLAEARKHSKPYMVAVDKFSKHVMIRRLSSLKGRNPVNALISMIEESGKPKSIYCDKGKEFKGHFFSDYCRDHNIQLIFANKLAPQVERMNRSIKELSEKYRKAYKTNIGDYIQDIADNINNRQSRPIKMTPNKAETGRHNKTVFRNLKQYLGKSTDVKNLHVGDFVRVRKFIKNPLTKGYKTKWTKTSYKIIYHSKNGIYTLDKAGDNKFNANYLKKVVGDEAPPQKKIKKGGVSAKMAKARAARKYKEYTPTKRITRAMKKKAN